MPPLKDYLNFREKKIPWPWNPLAGHLAETLGKDRSVLSRSIPGAGHAGGSLHTEEELKHDTREMHCTYQSYGPASPRDSSVESHMEENHAPVAMQGEVESAEHFTMSKLEGGHSRHAQMNSDPAIAALNFPAFAIRDPIAHLQPRRQMMRRTRDELVKKNNRAQVVEIILGWVAIMWRLHSL